MPYLRAAVVLGVLGLMVMYVPVAAPRTANVGTASIGFITGITGGQAGTGQPAIFMISRMPASMTSNPLVRLGSGWWYGMQNTGATPSGAVIPATQNEARQPVSELINDPSLISSPDPAAPSSVLHIDINSDTRTGDGYYAPARQSSTVSVGDLLSQLGEPRSGGSSAPASPFSSSPADYLWNLAFPQGEVPAVSASSPAPISGMSEARTPTLPVVQTSPASSGFLSTVSASAPASAGPSAGFQGPVAGDGTFVVRGGSSMDEHEYIREVIHRMQSTSFVTAADYSVAKQIAQHKVEEARAVLDTRTAFEKVMDWLGLASPSMAAYLQAQADLNDLAYTAGLIQITSEP